MILALNSSTTVTIDSQYLNLLIGTVLPLVVGLVTSKVTKSSVKRLLLIVLSVITGAATTIAKNGGTFNVKDTVVGIVIAYFTAETSYATVLKSTGLAQATAGLLGGVTIAADPAKVAALAGEATTADAAADVGSGDDVVAPAGDSSVGDAVDVVPSTSDVGDPADDETPYDVDPDPGVPVIDVADLPAEDPSA